MNLILILGDWGLGIGDWGLGIGPNPQSPIPNPQSPIPNIAAGKEIYKLFLYIVKYIKFIFYLKNGISKKNFFICFYI